MPLPLNISIAMPGSASPAHSALGTKVPFTPSLFSVGTSLFLSQTPRTMMRISFALMSKTAGTFIWASTTKTILNYPLTLFSKLAAEPQCRAEKGKNQNHASGLKRSCMMPSAPNPQSHPCTPSPKSELTAAPACFEGLAQALRWLELRQMQSHSWQVFSGSSLMWRSTWYCFLH